MYKKNDKNTLDSNDNNIMSFPEVNFITFILSLNSSALVQLGVLNDPITEKNSRNLILARNTIDTISMLKDKTEGNLNFEEKAIISNILYELRMIYINNLSK